MATRFRLPSSGTPERGSIAFQSYTHSGTVVRAPLPRAADGDSSALGTTALAPDGSDHLVAGDTLFFQFISKSMDGGITFTNGDAISLAVQCLEAHANNNLFVQLYVAIVNDGGETVQVTLRSKVNDGLEVATTLTNRNLTTTQSGATYTTKPGDRLLVEISLQGTPSATSGVQGHNGSIRFGSNGAGGDLGANDTDTGTTLNPWIDFAPTITVTDGVTVKSGQIGGGAGTAGTIPQYRNSWPKQLGEFAFPNYVALTVAPSAAETPQSDAVMPLCGPRKMPWFDPPSPLLTTLTTAPPTPAPFVPTALPMPWARRIQPPDPKGFLPSYFPVIAADTPNADAILPLPYKRIVPPRFDVPNLLTTTLAVAAPAGAPFKLVDWRMPRYKYVQLPDLGSAFVVSEDPAAQPRRQLDWPTPPGKRSPDRVAFTVSRILGLAQVEQKPFKQTEWPNPAKARTSPPLWWYPNTLTTTQFIVVAPPFVPVRWALPHYRVWMKSVQISGRVPGEVGAMPFSQTSWPNPALPRWMPPTYTQNIMQPQVLIQPLPFNQNLWPNPPIRRSLVQDFIPNLRTIAVPAQTPPPSQTDWPLPPRARRQFRVTDWVQNKPTYYVDAVVSIGNKGDVIVRNLPGPANMAQVTPSTAGFVLTSNGVGFFPSFQAIPGSYTVVYSEPFTGDGVTVAFVLAHTPVGLIAVYVSGVRVTNYTLIGATITFAVAPGAGAPILVDYKY